MKKASVKSGRGWARIVLSAEAMLVPRNQRRRTGEGRLELLEQDLKRAGVPFTEDFEGEDVVIVRWGPEAAGEAEEAQEDPVESSREAEESGEEVWVL